MLSSQNFGEFIDAILAVLPEYPFHADEDGSAPLATHNPLADLADLKPAIILPESLLASKQWCLARMART